MPTKRSTGTAAGAGNTRQAPGLERAGVSCAKSKRPSRACRRAWTWTGVRRPPAADVTSCTKRGSSTTRPARRSPAGDVDADWEDAYSVGDEAPGGDNPTPDQDRVDDIGKALGVEYEDNEELKASDKIAERDRQRWELDPASSDDYKDRD